MRACVPTALCLLISYGIIHLYLLHQLGSNKHDTVKSDISQTKNAIDHHVAEWFQDAKFGIFIHWGIYSVVAWADLNHDPRSEWYWYKVRVPESDEGRTANHHLLHYKNLTYEDFAKGFSTTSWNPDTWASMIKSSGAKFAVITAKHHDGFCLWPSKTSWNWNSVTVGPHMDILSRFARSMRDVHLFFGFSYSLMEWFHPLYVRDGETQSNAAINGSFVDRKVIPEIMDLLERYRPDILWADGDWERSHAYWNRDALLSHLRSRDVVTNDRWGIPREDPQSKFERGICDEEMLKFPWNFWMPISHSWGYNQLEPLRNFKIFSEISMTLARVVSCNGHVSLGISPDGNGWISHIQLERLSQLGNWFSTNGQAIFETRPWRIQRDPEDTNIVFTRNKMGSIIYAIFQEWPRDEHLHLSIDLIPREETDQIVTMLLYEVQCKFRLDADGMTIRLPSFVMLTGDATLGPWVLKFVGFR